MTGGTRSVRLLAQRQAVDEQTLDEMAAAECQALGVRLDTTWVDDLSGLGEAVRAAALAGDPLVVLVAPGSADLSELAGLADSTEPADVPVVRLDLAVREPDLSPLLATHVQGRGAWGLVWALRAAHHRRRYDVHTERYGDHPDQRGELRLPSAATGARHPVVTVLHGGFWRSCWQLDLMDALSIDLAERGLATWNLEYRRPDRHGWAATVADVRNGFRHLDELSGRWPLDVGRVAVVGHSAGGSMAVQVAGDAVGRPARAGVAGRPARRVGRPRGHPRAGHRQRCGPVGAGRDAGAGAGRLRAGLAAGAPARSGVPQLVVVGRSDSWDLREMSRRYVRAARAGGDDVELLEAEGDHFSVIEPSSAIWGQTADRIASRLLG